MLRINWGKSQLLPTHKLVYLGHTIDTTLMTLTLPEEKVQKILKGCQSTLHKDIVSVRDLSRLIGMMSAATLAVLPAPLHYRELQHLKIRTHSPSRLWYFLDMELKAEVEWWIEMLNRWNGHLILPLTPDLVIETDASLLGWGAATEQMNTGGLWSEEERTHHINLLELASGALPTKTFTKGRKNFHVLLRMDNTTAIAYINRMGGLVQACPPPTLHHDNYGPSCTSVSYSSPHGMQCC